MPRTLAYRFSIPFGAEPDEYRPANWRHRAIVELYLLGNPIERIAKWSGFKLDELSRILEGLTPTYGIEQTCRRLKEIDNARHGPREQQVRLG